MPLAPTHPAYAEARARGLAAIAAAPRTPPEPRPSDAQQRTLKGRGGPPQPRVRRILPPPELGAVVTLNCSPPLTGSVERVDLNRKLAYVRTEYGVQPYGFAEIKRGSK